MKKTDTPEDVFDTASSGSEFYIDAINCGLLRLSASVSLLSAHFDEDGGDRLDDEVIGNALWGIEGQITSIKKLLDLAIQKEAV